MSTSRKSPPKQTDPAVIDSAATVVASGNYNLTAEDLFSHIGDLTDSLAEAEAELDRLRGQQTVDQVKAEMLKPYVDKVYYFVLGYCSVVGIMLTLSAFKCTGFVLPETILAIIAGSTAVSVIGLIGLVITGLFGKS